LCRNPSRDCLARCGYGTPGSGCELHMRERPTPRPGKQQPTFDRRTETADSMQLSLPDESTREARSGLQRSLGRTTLLGLGSSCGLASGGWLAPTTRMPAYVLKCDSCTAYEPFLVHEDEVATATKVEAIQRYCPSCRRTTGWVVAFRERRDGHDRRGGSDRRLRSKP